MGDMKIMCAILIVCLTVCSGLLSDPALLISDEVAGTVYHVGLANRKRAEIAYSTNPWGLDYDPDTQIVYWADHNDKTIYSKNLSNRSSKQQLKKDLSGVRDIAIAGRKLYITQILPGIISRMNLDASNHEVIIDSNLKEPQYIVLDQDVGYLYWSDAGMDKIERATLHGSERIELLTKVDAWGLTLDKSGGRLFWCDFYFGIWTSNLLGNNKRLLYDVPGVTFWFYDITFYNGYLLYTARNNTSDEAGVFILSAAGQQGPWTSAMFSQDNFFWPYCIHLYQRKGTPPVSLDGEMNTECSCEECNILCHTCFPCQEQLGANILPTYALIIIGVVVAVVVIVAMSVGVFIVMRAVRMSQTTQSTQEQHSTTRGYVEPLGHAGQNTQNMVRLSFGEYIDIPEPNHKKETYLEPVPRPALQ